MKRSPRTVFDDSGTKWYQSPLYKEGKIGEVTPEATTRIREEYVGDPTKLVRDRFYDFFQRVTRQGEPRIDTEELNKSLTIKVDDLPDSTKIQDIFERLNSKVALNSKGKKNWSEEETTFFIWIILTYCDLNKYDYQDLNDSDWDYLASLFPGKKSDQCKVRWQSLLKVNLSRAPWSQKEDEVLAIIISEKGGTKKWKEIALELNQRCGNTKFFRQGKQCRERWINHLDPTINRGIWTHQEDIKLLEAHLEVGKKWAEIAKRLKSRTENSVKNRWNSLMKKYKTDSDSDTLSSKSGYSDSSGMDDLEKKIANMIINEKKRELTYTNTPSRISEVPEEEYLSDNDDSLQTSTQISNNPFGEEEDKEESTTKTTGSVSKKKSGGIIDVNKSKNALRNLVREDIDIKQQQNTQKTIPPSQNPSYMNSSTNNVLFPQGITQIQGNPIFGNPQPSNQILGSTNGFLNFSKPPTSNNRPTPKQPVESSPGLFNRPGGNFNNQGAPMNNLFGMSGDMLNLNLLMMNQNNLNLYNSDNVQENSQNLQRSTGSLEYLTEIKPDEEKVFKFVEKTPETFNPNDFSGLHYAAVDVNQGFIYFLSPITKDNFPPPFTSNQVNTNNSLNQMKGNSNNKISSTGNVDFIMASPHLGSVNFSPNPFSNSNLISLVKNQFSPGMNFFQESPGMDPRFINPDQRINSWNNEWTPETPSRPITIDANKMKQANLVWGNQFHRSSPEQRMMLNNSALMARQQQQIFQMSQGMNMERQKKEENSPTVFLSDTNKNNNLLFQTKQLI